MFLTLFLFLYLSSDKDADPNYIPESELNETNSESEVYPLQREFQSTTRYVVSNELTWILVFTLLI